MAIKNPVHGVNGNIVYEHVISHCRVSLPEGIPIILLAPAEKWKKHDKESCEGLWAFFFWSPFSKEVAMQENQNWNQQARIMNPSVLCTSWARSGYLVDVPCILIGPVCLRHPKILNTHRPRADEGPCLLDCQAVEPSQRWRFASGFNDHSPYQSKWGKKHKNSRVGILESKIPRRNDDQRSDTKKQISGKGELRQTELSFQLMEAGYRENMTWGKKDPGPRTPYTPKWWTVLLCLFPEVHVIEIIGPVGKMVAPSSHTPILLVRRIHGDVRPSAPISPVQSTSHLAHLHPFVEQNPLCWSLLFKHHPTIGDINGYNLQYIFEIIWIWCPKSPIVGTFTNPCQRRHLTTPTHGFLEISCQLQVSMDFFDGKIYRKT